MAQIKGTSLCYYSTEKIIPYVIQEFILPLISVSESDNVYFQVSLLVYDNYNTKCEKSLVFLYESSNKNYAKKVRSEKSLKSSKIIRRCSTQRWLIVSIYENSLKNIQLKVRVCSTGRKMFLK